MIAIVSPAKTLDFDTPAREDYTLPRFPKQTQALVEVLKEKSAADLQALMSISDKIAGLNEDRYKHFKSRHNTTNAKPSMFAFKGDVYQGLDPGSFSDIEVGRAQNKLRILSGLYGLLRPLDLIQPYRLEMGTKLAFDDYKTLYDYWAGQIAERLNKDLKAQGDHFLVNLASEEYFKSLKQPNLKAKVIDVTFQDFKNGQYKIVSFFAKKARGMMARYIIKNDLNQPEELIGFEDGGYGYDTEASTETQLVFRRG